MQTPALSPVLHDQLKWKALIDKSALFLDRNLVQLHPGLSCGEAAPGIAQYLSTFKQWAYEKPETAWTSRFYLGCMFPKISSQAVKAKLSTKEMLSREIKANW